MRRSVLTLLGLAAVVLASCNVDWDCGDVCSSQDPVDVVNPMTDPHQCPSTSPHIVTLGYWWDGQACHKITGCHCSGNCDLLYATEAECTEPHQACIEHQCE